MRLGVVGALASRRSLVVVAADGARFGREGRRAGGFDPSCLATGGIVA